MKGILPDSSRGLIDMLSLFMPGDCMVIGDYAGIALKTRIDMPTVQPLSNTINVWDEWRNEVKLDVSVLVDKLFK
jgi:hypothetical protein